MEAAGITSGFSVVNAQTDELPDPAVLTGTVIIGGASGNLYNPEPWMDKLVAFTKVLLDLGRVNIFGICFGHQVVVTALGGKIAKNPNGRELGVYAVELTSAGWRHPLFKGIDDHFTISQSHSDAVTLLPTLRQAEVLAANDNSSVQALSIQSPVCVATVQFHPDLSAKSIAALVNFRRKILINEGLAADDAAVERLIAHIKEQQVQVEAARLTIIRNFMIMTKKG
jgi:GMP synthase-like glutamine amidotransferase